MRDNIIRYTRLRETDPCIDFIVQYFWYDEEAGEMKTDTIRDTEIWPERFVPDVLPDDPDLWHGSCVDEKPWIEKALQEEANDDRCTAHELNVPCDICDGEE